MRTIATLACVCAAPRISQDLAQRLHRKIHGSSFKKTDFALALLAKNPDDWIVPHYISEGLQWLEAELGVAEAAEEAAEDDGA